MATIKNTKSAAKNETFAVIETGGKQYLVSVGQKIKAEKLEGNPGDVINFDRVLMFGDDTTMEVGHPIVKTTVSGKIIRQDRHAKVTTLKYRPKARHHRKVGHKQPFTEIEITSIK